MKLRFKKFLSLILTFTLLLSFFNGLSFKYFYLNAYATTDEDTADAVADAASVSYGAGDWEKAAKDGCPKNFFHNAVQNYLIDPKNGYGFEKEKHIDYNKLVTNPVTKKETSFGSADIYKQKDLTTFYVWEVKPCSYNNADRAQLALEQLANYTNTSLHKDQKKTYKIGGKDAPLEYTTEFIEYSPFGVKYKISFWSHVKYDGLILYKFKRDDDDDDDDEEDDTKAESIDNTKENVNTDSGYSNNSEIDSYEDELFDLWWKYKIVRSLWENNDNSKGGGNSGGGSIDEIIAQAQGRENGEYGGDEGQLPRIDADKLRFVSFAASIVLLDMNADEYTSLKYWKVVLASVEFAAQYIYSNAIYVRAESGDYYELPDTETSRQYVKIINEAEEFLKLLGMDDDSYDTESIDEDELEEKIRQLNEEYEEAKNQTPPRDPLIIHFGNEESIVLTNLDNGVNFDLDANGFDEKTAWIGTEEGFLAYDRDENQSIDNGSELFGDRFLMSNGKTSSNGFEALASLNENDDFVINKDDTAFFKLSVWFDRNHNGKTEKNELKSLDDLNIISIGFVPESDGTVHVDSNVLEAESAVVSFSNNTTRKISEFWFPVDTLNTIHEGITSVGNVPDLAHELEKREDEYLVALFDAFRSERNIGKKRYYLKHILYHITGADNVSSNSRGGNIDARDLYVIEQFMGTEFEGVDGKNPNSVAAETLKRLYSSIEDFYYNHVNSLTEFSILHLYTSVKTDGHGGKYIKYDKVNAIFDEGIKNGYNVDATLYDFGKYLIYLDNKHGTNTFSEFKQRYSALSVHYANVLSLIDNTRTIIGSENSEEIYGTKYIDFIFGEGGNDTLSGDLGSDYFYSSYGNESMNGCAGDDTYYFDIFHSNDIVNDIDGYNRIIFTDGLSMDDYITAVTTNGSFVLTNKYNNDTITLIDFINHPLNYDFLSYDEAMIIDGESKRKIFDGTNYDDSLAASNEYNVFYCEYGNDTICGGTNIDFMYGGNGDDSLLGGNGTNIMYGEAGNDIIYDGDDSSYLNGGDDDDMLYGGGGADILDGGAGNDYLQGDHGNDFYIYGRGYDVDTISASSDLHTIVIHDYKVGDMFNTRELNNDLVIDLGKETGDRLIVKAFFDFNANRSFSFLFDDGSVLGQHDIKAEIAPIVGTDDCDYLMGSDENDTLDGGAGEDNLCGGNGEDTYIFGRGYSYDYINEWTEGINYIVLKDIASDNITVSDQWGNLIISVNDTEDVLTVNNFKWEQASYTIRFVDGAEGYVDKNTWELVLTKKADLFENENELEELGVDYSKDDKRAYSELEMA